MLYATVNSIKTLYSKVENLVAKIKTDNQRISNLKKDNEELNNRLDKLADELTKLEAKKN
jgi:predicted nuclease with TOPRIM domain